MLNWYRVHLGQPGRKLAPVELPAHSALDAIQCAFVKAGVARSDGGDYGDAEVLDLDCIEPPEHAQERARRRSDGLRGFQQLTEKLQRTGDGAGEPPPPSSAA